MLSKTYIKNVASVLLLYIYIFWSNKIPYGINERTHCSQVTLNVVMGFDRHCLGWWIVVWSAPAIKRTSLLMGIYTLTTHGQHWLR